jgi:hypothetical protein
MSTAVPNAIITVRRTALADLKAGSLGETPGAVHVPGRTASLEVWEAFVNAMSIPGSRRSMTASSSRSDPHHVLSVSALADQPSEALYREMRPAGLTPLWGGPHPRTPGHRAHRWHFEEARLSAGW